MIIIDVDFDVIKEMSMKAGGGSFFYTEDAKGFVIYKEFNRMLFRCYEEKEGNPMQDEIFRATYLGKPAMRVYGVHPESSIKDKAWRRAFTKMYHVMGAMHDRMVEIETQMEKVR